MNQYYIYTCTFTFSVHYTRSDLPQKTKLFTKSKLWAIHNGLIGKTMVLNGYDEAEKHINGSTLPVISFEVSGTNQVAFTCTGKIAILYKLNNQTILLIVK